MATAQGRVGFFGASGDKAGSGIRNALDLCKRNMLKSINPVVVASCNPFGGILGVARDYDLPFYHFEKPYNEERWRHLVRLHRLDYLALIGCGIRVVGLQDMTGRIFNEHPADLTIMDPDNPKKPLFGGKGMTDLHVHRKVINLGYKRSGSTTHFVVCDSGTDDDYDAGQLLIGVHGCDVPTNATPEMLQEAVKDRQKATTPFDLEAVVSGRTYLAYDKGVPYVARD